MCGFNKIENTTSETPPRLEMDAPRTVSYYIEKRLIYYRVFSRERWTTGSFGCFFIRRHLNGQNLYYLFSVRPYFTRAPHSLIPGAHVTRLRRTYFHLKNFPLRLEPRPWGSSEVLRRLSFFFEGAWPMCFKFVKERGKTFKRVRGLSTKL